MASHYLKQIEELVSQLKATPDIEVRHTESGSPASEDDLATARTYALYHLPEGVEQFYREMNGFQLEWEFVGEVPDGETPDSGSINLLPVQRIFASWKGTTWFNDFEGGDRFQAVKPFDLFQPEACAAFSQQPDESPQDEVYFHYFGEDLSPMGCTFSKYFDLLIASRGYLYWQRSLLPGAASDTEVRHFKKRMHALFPDFDADLFKPIKSR